MPTLPERLSLVRPDDMLVLEFGFSNLRLSDDGKQLVRIERAQPAVLSVQLPPQHLAETTYGETEQGQAPAGPPPVAAVAAAPSRLSFTLGDEVDSIPFSVDALLGWEALLPRLAPNALPPGAAQGPAPALPPADTTAIEFPYRLLLSPDQTGRWRHRHAPFLAAGRAELWHTRLENEDGAPASVRAIARRPQASSLNASVGDKDLDDLVTLSGDFSRRALIGGSEQPLVPQPIHADQLILTALGATARLRGRWDLPPEAEAAGPRLQQYEHIAGLGRDQYVRLVHRGFVHSGHRAALFQVTERRFEPNRRPDGHPGVGATAYLRKYYTVLILQPELDYEALAAGYRFGGREMPLRRLRFTMLASPKLDPRTVPPRPPAPAQPGQPLPPPPFAPFWVRTGQGDVEFSFVATDWEGQQITGSMPLMFLPLPPPGSVDAMALLMRRFMEDPPTRRKRPLANQPVALAARGDGAPGSTCAATQDISFALQLIDGGREAALFPAYLPPWLLCVEAATVRVDAISRLTGQDAPSEIRFDDDYLKGAPGKAAAAGVFARLSTAPIPVELGGPRGGGLAAPSFAVDCLSRRQGVLSSKFIDPGGAAPDLNAIFGGARILGCIALTDILGEIGSLTSEHFNKADLAEEALTALLEAPDALLEVPLLRSRRLLRPGKPEALETRFLWKPPLKSSGIIAFGQGAMLVLDARIITPLGGGEPETSVRGELRHFSLVLAEVVELKLQSLRFLMQPGSKPDISAEGFDIEFKGALSFVNTLQSILPADGFSDPPAVEVTPEGIRAGYSLGIPTLGVGVFSLQNLSLSAALSVPFVGPPASFRFAVSERHHPFLVSVTLFGGGGFFALTVNAKGLEQVEAAIEFGGNISLNLGVASGGVYVMAGVYFALKEARTELTGYLRCGGYLSVLGLISLSLEFYLAFSFREVGGGSEIYGQARLTVCVEVLCFSKSVELSIERRFAGAAGDPSFDEVVEPPDWQTYCLAFAAENGS